MMVRRLLMILAVVGTTAAFGQQEAKNEKKYFKPNIPGNFMVDFGFNFAVDEPATFDKGFWGSRTGNFYYYFPLRFGDSKLSFNPGIGVSLERFKFVNGYILQDTIAITESALVPGIQYPGLKKSMLIANYFEIPIEFRFDTNPDDMARTFWIAVGARGGVLMNAHTKLKYKESGQTKKLKDQQRFGLNPYRLAASLRVGIGAFNWFMFYNFSPLFEVNSGPQKTTMNTWTLGISINGL